MYWKLDSKWENEGTVKALEGRIVFADKLMDFVLYRYAQIMIFYYLKIIEQIWEI